MSNWFSGNGGQNGSPYSFIPGVNDYGAKLSADQGISKITGMDPNQVEQMASGHGLDYWQQQQSGAPGGGFGFGAAPQAPQGGYGVSANPYQGPQADAIRGQSSQLFGDMNQQIKGGAIATGGYGGSRMGVAQGVAMGRAATGMDSALAGLYGSNWQADQGRALQQYQGDQQFYGQQRGQDMQQAALGANLYGLGQQGEWNPYQQFTQTLSPFTGFGPETKSSQQGGGWQDALGTGLGMAQFGYNNGWWGNKPTGT
jgi:hypothetical protein